MSGGRIAAVDAFRGITIAAMILVNNPGSWGHVYAPMLHARWHGWTPTDLIFPFFIFIVGIAASYAVPRQMGSMSRSDVMQKAFIRGGKLILLGLFLAVFFYNVHDPSYSWWHERVEQIRIPGVLQRIGIVFICTVLIMCFCRLRGQLIAAASLIAAYLAGMMLIRYPVTGASYQGLWAFGNSFSAWLDYIIFSPSHLYYADATPFPFDPEGLFSTLPAIVSCLSGVWAGQWLQSSSPLQRKAQWLVVAGLTGIAIAYLADSTVPINKALWTPSYVCLSSGIGALVLALLVVIMDIGGHKGWAKPFIVCGSNSIAFYMLAGVLARVLLMIPVGDSSLQGWLYRQLFVPIGGELNGSLLYAVSFLIVCYLPIYWMYRKEIFWKV